MIEPQQESNLTKKRQHQQYEEIKQSFHQDEGNSRESFDSRKASSLSINNQKLHAGYQQLLKYYNKGNFNLKVLFTIILIIIIFIFHQFQILKMQAQIESMKSNVLNLTSNKFIQIVKEQVDEVKKLNSNIKSINEERIGEFKNQISKIKKDIEIINTKPNNEKKVDEINKQIGEFKNQISKIKKDIEIINIKPNNEKKVDEINKQIGEFKNQIIKIKKDIEQNLTQVRKQFEKIKTQNNKIADIERSLRKKVQKKQLYERLADLRNDLAVHRQKEDIILTPKGTVSQLNLSRTFNGMKLGQYLYSSEDRQKRIQYFKYRKELLLKNKIYNNKETPFNYIDLSYYDQNPQNKEDTRQYDKLNSIWKLDQIKQELPMCLLASSYNNEAYFRIELNLNSIFQQNYSNYFAIIINDKSTDRSHEIYKRYFKFYNISKEKYIYFNSHMKKDNIQNYYYAASAYCSENSIMVHIDGDDELLGKNVLKVLNSVYQKQKPGFVYSLSHSVYNYARKSFKIGTWPGRYSQQQKKKNAYRQIGMRYFHLRSYQSSLYRKIKLEDMMEQNQHFFEIGYDYVLFMPLVELSCGRLGAIDYNCYLYNEGTGYGQADSKYVRQQYVQRTVVKKQKYTCDSTFLASINQKDKK